MQSAEWEGSVDNLYGDMMGVETWDVEGCSDELDFHKRVLCMLARRGRVFVLGTLRCMGEGLLLKTRYWGERQIVVGCEIWGEGRIDATEG